MTEIEVEQMKKAVEEISKLSTAPDRETPDWMETDIRRGYEKGFEDAKKGLDYELLNKIAKLLREREDLLRELRKEFCYRQ